MSIPQKIYYDPELMQYVVECPAWSGQYTCLTDCYAKPPID